MKTIEIKTNIMCGSCIAKITPALNNTLGEGNWKVNTLSPNKILTVNTERLVDEDIIMAVQQAGYKAEKLT